MPQFFTGSELNVQLEKLIANADDFLFLVSPYIKIHGRIKEVLDSKTTTEKLEIWVLFGKNEDDVSKSLSEQELDYLKKFPNLKVKHQERLHAKYFANDTQTLFTSMNLYDFSFEKNIEFGILTPKKSFRSDKLDKEAFEYFKKVFEQSDIVFEQKAKFKSSFGGLKKKYDGIEVVEDNTGSFYGYSNGYSNNRHYERSGYGNQQENGHCIRCATEIEFNPSSPFCYSCYSTWASFGNRQYQEVYCHKTGNQSYGRTSMEHPIDD